MMLRGVKMLMVLALVAVCITGCPTTSTVVSVSPVSATLEAAQSLTLTASSTDIADAPFAWTNSNPAVATLSAVVGNSVVVTSVAPGTTTITVTGSNSHAVGVATIAVPTSPDQPEPTVLTVTPSSAAFEVGQNLTLTAASSNAADTFAWTQTNAAAAGLSATTGGSITLSALATGITVVTATGSVSGDTASATISVLTPASENPATSLVPEGLVINVTGVVIPADRRPEVTFTATNTRGDIIPFVEFSEMRFIIDHLDEAPPAGNSAQYISYINNAVGQATYDGAGIAGLKANSDSTYTYKFKSALPAGYSVTASHAVGAQIVRKSTLDGKSYPFNVDYEFRPDGNPVTVTRDVTTTEKCDNCHTRLGLHGGNRREVRLCILCHNPGSVDPDTGNTVDMKVFIHKIHMGENLPSVLAGTPYQIIGYQGSVNDYSTVALPQDIRACDICHVAGPETKALNTQADYLTKPTQAACGSCHDRTWFGNPTATPEGFTNHPLDFLQADDSMCATCHTPTAPGVAPIAQFHVPVQELNENPGLDLKITATAVDPTTGALTISFTAKNGDGTPITDITPVTRAGAIVAWPAADYTTNASETINKVGGSPSGTVVNTTSPTGEYQYIFKKKLPVGTNDTFAVVMTGRQEFQDSEGNTEEQGLNDSSLTFFTTDGSTPVPHRAIVDNSLCANCHGETIRGHGGQRIGVETCEMCHNTTAGDINLKDMLHKFHRGENLTQPFSVGSFVANDVRFPGLLQQCSICHGKHNVTPPLAPEALPTIITNDDNSTTTILPERAACTSCHDSLIDGVHAVTNADAASGVEACAVCHGTGKDFAVSTVHALVP